MKTSAYSSILAIMHCKLPTILILLLLAGCVGTSNPPGDPVETPEQDSQPSDPIQDIATEFKRLRAVKGHFDGGDWNDDVDKWMGRKHQLMIQLGDRLDTGEYSKAQIIQWLDPPDLVAREGDDLFDLVSSLPEFGKPATGPYELLIYHWRATHDFLYFVTQNETIISSGWWYAGE